METTTNRRWVHFPIWSATCSHHPMNKRHRSPPLSQAQKDANNQKAYEALLLHHQSQRPSRLQRFFELPYMALTCAIAVLAGAICVLVFSSLSSGWKVFLGYAIAFFIAWLCDPCTWGAGPSIVRPWYR